MVVATILHRKVFTSVEYFLAVCISAGLVIFAAADWNTTPTFHPIGLAFVSLSVCADAILPNAQERLFKQGSSRLEVTVFTNVFTLIAMTVTTLFSGDLLGLISWSMTSESAYSYIAVYTFIAYIAVSVHMTVVRRFGGVTAVLVATGRKIMTIIISFLLFPKGFSWLYVIGAFLVLGGLLLSSLYKIQRKKATTTMMQPLLDSRTHELQLEELINDHQGKADVENCTCVLYQYDSWDDARFQIPAYSEKIDTSHFFTQLILLLAVHHSRSNLLGGNKHGHQL